MIHKNPQMYKDHGYTLKIHLLQQLKKAKPIKDCIKTMNSHYLLGLEKELDFLLVINQVSIDIKEAKLLLLKINRLLESEIE